MEELTSINPHAIGIDKGNNKRGMCAFETAKKIRKLWEERSKKIEEQFGSSDPVRFIPEHHFVPRTFGTLCRSDSTEFAATIVSLALSDDGQHLFECTGIALQSGTSTNGLTRFLTSGLLGKIFQEKRNREDKLKIEVGVSLVGMGPNIGFLELYDDDIAIVTSLLSHPEVVPLDLDAQEILLPAGSGVIAIGKPFCLPVALMIQRGNLIDPSEEDSKHLGISDCAIEESGLGGPLLACHDNSFVGMNIRCAEGKTWFLSSMLIRERLEQFQILTMGETDDSGQEGADDSGQEESDDDSGQEETCDTNVYGVGTSSGTPEISSQGYSPPQGAKRILPSGFMRTIKWLESLGYPTPPPLMLELNGQLLDTFEEFFGYLHAWKGYPFSLSCCGEGANPWARLGSNIIKHLSRRVVSLASFNGATRFFACTGLLIKCRVGRCYDSVAPSRTVILTSASLVRTCDATDTINEKLRIEVFLPPNQRVSGTLVAYDLCYNLAIISAECLRVICPEDILLVDTPDQIRDRQLRKMSREQPETVVAIGREPQEGLLCGSMGVATKKPTKCGSMGVVTKKPTKCGFKDLRLSTCKTKKAVIGRPLVSFPDGGFVGMNFYNGRTTSTPFLPRMYIVNALRQLELRPAGSNHPVQRLDTPVTGSMSKKKSYWVGQQEQMASAQGKMVQ